MDDKIDGWTRRHVRDYLTHIFDLHAIACAAHLLNECLHHFTPSHHSHFILDSGAKTGRSTDGQHSSQDGG